MIRELGGTPRAGASPASHPPAAQPQAEGEGTTAAGRLSDLDEALAAIEVATQTLERAYSDEPRPDQPAGTEATSSGDAPKQGWRTDVP